MNPRSTRRRIALAFPRDLSWAVIVFTIPQVLLLLTFPILRNPGNLRLLLYGPYLYLAFFASISLSPLLGLIGFQFDLPSYRPWHPGELAFILFVNLFLISLFSLILFSRFFRTRHAQKIAIVVSLVWAFVLVHVVGDIFLAIMAVIASNLGSY